METTLNILFASTGAIILVLFGAIIYYTVTKKGATRDWITNGFILAGALLLLTWILSIINGL